MAENSQLAVTEDRPMDLKVAAQQQIQLNNFIATQMKDGSDYGVIPGTQKKSLWQPGAQKLLYYNGLGARMIPTDKCVLNWEEPFFFYEYKCEIFSKRLDKVVATCFGSANSKEDRYAYRWVPEKKLMRGVDKNELPAREGKYGMMYRTQNPEIFSLPNTLQKMAQKRALTGATLLACRAADNFTTDIEEMEEEIIPPKAAKKNPPTAREKATAAQPAKDPSIASEKQIIRLRAIQKECGIDNEMLKAFLSDKYKYLFDEKGMVHLSQIKKKDYEPIVVWVQEHMTGDGQ